MGLSGRKTFWWSMLAASMGGTAFFVYICCIAGAPPPRMFAVYAWPAVCMAMSGISIYILRRIYRDEPGGIRGLWQLSIVDLYAIILFTALWMAAMRSAWPGSFLPVGIAVSLTMGLGYLVSMLVAARKGFAASRHKIPYAAGLVFKTTGLLALGALVVTCAFVLIYRGDMARALEVVSYCLFLESADRRFLRDIMPIRIGLVFLPMGLVICWWVRGLHSKWADEQRHTDAGSSSREEAPGRVSARGGRAGLRED